MVTSVDQLNSGWVYSFELADKSVGCSGSGMLVANYTPYMYWLRCDSRPRSYFMHRFVLIDEMYPYIGY